MRYQLLKAWPVGQFCIEAGTVIDTDANDQWSQLVKNLPPPLTAMPVSYTHLTLPTIYSV